MNLSVDNISRILRLGLDRNIFSIRHLVPNEAFYMLPVSYEIPDEDKLISDKSFQISEIIRNVNPITLSKDPNLYNNKEYYHLIFFDKPTAYVLSRLLIEELKKAFNISLPDRNSLLDALDSSIRLDRPKAIIRTDISSFFECVNHKRLFGFLESNDKVSQLAKQFFYRIFLEFDRHRSLLNKSGFGLPRGLAVSSYLAEVYLTGIDSIIKSDGELSFYGRYVDDIVITISNTSSKTPLEVFKNLKEEFWKLDLKLHEDQNKKFSIINLGDNEIELGEYLGYSLSWNPRCEKLDFRMPFAKIQRKQTMIDKAFLHFERVSRKDLKKARRDLIDCLNFISANYLLKGNKNKIITGIYYANEHLTSLDALDDLSQYVHNKPLLPYTKSFSSFVDYKKYVDRLRKKIDVIDFRNNWENRKMISLSPYRIGRLKAIMNTA